MNLTKFSLTPTQFDHFYQWLSTHITVNPRRYLYSGYSRDPTWLFLQLLLSRHYGVQLLNWQDRTFYTTQPANAGFFVLAMSNGTQAHAQ